jgi:hypothetical protein
MICIKYYFRKVLKFCRQYTLDIERNEMQKKLEEIEEEEFTKYLLSTIPK